MDKKRFRFVQGNEACVEGALTAGMRFYSGYPITPSTEIAEQSAIILPKVGGHFIQMEDEIGGIAAALGASAAGVKSMTATSGPGFSLKQENIGYGCLAEIPIVVVDVQRSGPSTGMPTSPSQGDVMQARWGTHGDHPMIAIAPSSVQDTYNQTIRCFNLAEKYRTPVILLMDEIIGHLREGLEVIPAEELEIVDRGDHNITGMAYAVGEGEYVPEFAPFGEGEHYNITGLFHNDAGFPTNDNTFTDKIEHRLMAKIEKNLDDILDWEEYMLDDAEYAIVAYGGTVRAAKGAIEQLRAEGIKVGLFRPVTVWPFPEEAMKAVAKKVKGVIVAEHNYGQLLLEVERVIKNDAPLSFVGKVDGTTLKPEDIAAKVKEVL